jgi:hypothetical protein
MLIVENALRVTEFGISAIDLRYFAGRPGFE